MMNQVKAKMFLADQRGLVETNLVQEPAYLQFWKVFQ